MSTTGKSKETERGLVSEWSPGAWRKGGRGTTAQRTCEDRFSFRGDEKYSGTRWR